VVTMIYVMASISQPMFQEAILPPSSESKRESSKKLAKCRAKHVHKTQAVYRLEGNLQANKRAPTGSP
jgi:hypothetical protein